MIKEVVNIVHLICVKFISYFQLGPEKGVMHLAVAAVVNALWDLWAKIEGKVRQTIWMDHKIDSYQYYNICFLLVILVHFICNNYCYQKQSK